MDGYMKMNMPEDMVTHERPENYFMKEASTEVKVIAGEVVRWEESYNKTGVINEFVGMQRMYARSHELLTENQRVKQKDRIETKIQVGTAAEVNVHYMSKENEMVPRMSSFVDLTNESTIEDGGLNKTFQEELFECDICRKTYTRRTNLMRHRRRHATDPARVQQSDRSRPARSEQQVFACDICLKTFMWRKSMLKHRRRHILDPGRPLNGDGSVRPEETSQNNFLGQATYNLVGKRHEQLVANEDRANRTTEACEAEVQYTPIVQNFIAKPLTISPRKLDFVRKAEVEVCVSADTQKGMVVTNDAPMQQTSAKISNQSGTDPGVVPMSRSEQPLRKRDRAYDDVDEITDCWKCDMKFASRSALIIHMKTHRTQFPFRCYLCDASYNSRLESVSHLAEKHSSDWKDLKEKYNITNIEAFAMQVDKAVENRCDALKASLTTMGGNDSPVEIFDDYLQRKIYCSFCPMRFRRNIPDLRRHMCSHTGKRGFQCDICPKSFTARYNLERHRKTHSDCPARISDGNETVMPYNQTEGKSEFKCDICQKSFTTRFNLESLKKNHADSLLTKASNGNEIAMPHNPIEDTTTEKRPNADTENLLSQSSKAATVEIVNCSIEQQTSDLVDIVEPMIEGHENYVTSIEKMDGYSEMSLPADTEIGANKDKMNSKKYGLETERNGYVKLEEADKSFNILSARGNDVGSGIEGQREQSSTDVKTRPLTEARQTIIYKNKGYNENGAECFKCNRIFTSKIDLARHRQTHRTDSPFKCYLCDASYDKRWACLEHISEVHTSDWAVLKEKYGLIDLEKFSAKVDKLVEAFSKKLSADSVAEITKQDLKEINMKTIPLDYKWRKIYCCLCPLKLWSMSKLKQHMGFHTGERLFKCDICLKSFSKEYNLRRHKKNLADTHSQDTVKELPADTEHLSDFEGSHDKENMSPDTQQLDFESQQSRPVKNLLQTVDDRPNNVSRCQFVPNSQDENLEHSDKETNDQTVGENNSQDKTKTSLGDTSRLCHLCAKTSLNLNALKCHMLDVHKKRHFCHICNKVFPKRHTLLRHMHVHNGIKPFPCITCGKQFVTENYLRKHEYEHTGGQWAWQCEFCDIKFPTSEKLNSHMKLRHRLNQFQCPVCAKSFISRSCLAEHEITHTGERAYNCDICGRNYSTLSCIRRHMLYHFKDVIGVTFKVYTCETCGRKFKSKDVLDRHVRSHTAEKICICDICGLLLASVPGLKAHLKTHLAPSERKKTAEYECNVCHKKFSQYSSMTTHKRIHTDDKRYSCEICGKKFTQSYSLTVHMRVHTGSKPFECEICGQRYTQSYPLTVHKRKKHPVLPSNDSQA